MLISEESSSENKFSGDWIEYSRWGFQIKRISGNNETEENYNEYDLMIKNSGGIDIQILGIGTNGHIAFNEPGSNRYSSTRIVDLTENTIKDNSRFFDNL